MSMNAVEFIKTKKRLCLSVSCRDCPIFEQKDKANLTCIQWFEAHPEETVSIIEKWAREHPAKTRQSEFLKMFPNVMRNNEGQPYICPRTLDTVYQPDGDCALDVDICQRCRAKFWGQEVE